MHYYGPDIANSKEITFHVVPAASVIADILYPKLNHGIGLDDFRGKIVLIGTTAAATYDMKTSPYGPYPGVELNATAIENMLFRQRVRPISQGGLIAFAALVSAAATVGSLYPRRLWVKFGLGLLILTVVILPARFLFLQSDIRWLDPSGPLLGAVCAILLSLGWSYFTEDRQARFFLRALGQYLSPHVAAELRTDPTKLSLSTESRELTILFSDIVDFTPLSERLGNEIGPLLNFYLGEMSEPVLASDGTLDKYIGDAVMCFWNAPLRQEDHAGRACRAALAMKKRLGEIRPKLVELGAPDLDCRIGINSGLVTFGNMGSSRKFNYSVIGDAVNFASRLEGANKFYGTGIMVGQATAEQVHGKFFLRKLDLLRVKGKTRPAAVYELMTEGQPDDAMRKIAEQYESAFESYQRRDWATAEKNLLELLRQFPDDGPAKVLIKRIQEFAVEAPAENWDGVYVAKSK
jgi:adenylate cyclase